MKLRSLIWVLPLIAVSAAVAQPRGVELVEEWINPDAPRVRFNKIMVVGIVEERDTRHNFENKFVSFMRARKRQAETSYMLVPDLTHIDAEGEILRELKEKEVDAVITVRLFPLDKKSAEAAWAVEWRGELESDITARQVIEAALPVAGTKASNYGVQVTLWNVETGAKVWGGRSGAIARSTLKKGKAGALITQVMNALFDSGLL